MAEKQSRSIEYKILQIIPANGWRAGFKTNSGTVWESLGCWALVQFSPATDHGVIGMVQDEKSAKLVPVVLVDSFVGYRPPDSN